MRRVSYAHTTIIEDDLKNRLITLQSFGCDDIFQETLDPQMKIDILDGVEKPLSAGDTFIVCELHHLGRTARQSTDFIKVLRKKQVDFTSISEGIDTHLSAGEVYFQLMEGLSTMEYALAKRRMLVGLHKTREDGRVGGRPKIDGHTVCEIRALYYKGKKTIQFISNKCGVSVGICYKYINLSEASVERLCS